MSERFLVGKTALVTGSTSGIGLGLAKALAKAGANVVLNGFGPHEQAVAEVAAWGVDTAFHGADMRKASEIEAMMQFAAERFGRIDVLVNNAGIQYVSPLEDFPTQKWDDVIAVNLTSAFHTTRLALPAMRQANWGRILNIASVHGLVGSANKSAYVAAKHGIVGLTKVTALETATTGVTCNAVCPGWVDTPLLDAFDEMTRMGIRMQTPIGRLARAEELAQVVRFLAGPESSYCIGDVFPVSGGWV